MSGGIVTNEGGSSVIARGVCWNTSSNPTISNNHTNDGSGTGSFTSSITGLVANTTYYVRAYATNSEGPTYGEEVSFATPSCPTIIITSAPTVSVCDNVALNYTATSSTAGATFAWTRAFVAGITNTAGTGATALINETLDNTTTVPVNVTYVIIPSYGDCAGTPFNLVVTVNPLPIPTLTSSDADNIFCAGTSVTFTAEGGTNYNFRMGGTSVQNGESATYTTNALTNGQIVVVIVTNSNGCTSTSTGITNTVNALPIATATNNGPVCVGTVLNLNGGPAGMTTYSWTGPNGFTSSSQSPMVSDNAIVAVSGVYALTVTNSNGCQGLATTTVTVNPLPTATISDPITICKDAPNPSVTFTGVGGTPPYTFSYSVNDSAPISVSTSGENSSVDV